MLWDKIIGQPEVVSQLKAATTNNTLSHAYLFVGPTGLGKRTTAKVFAASLNCPEAGCGHCLTCTRVDHETYPDVFLIEPKGNFLTIGQIRDLRHRAELKPFEGQIKVFILDDVGQMTPAAANALLKTLEEPPSDLILVLITNNLEAVLPTLVSRCQLVRFKNIPPSQMIGLLIENCRLDKEQATLITRISRGIFGNALALANSEEQLSRRKTILKLIPEIKGADPLRVFEIVDQIFPLTESPEEVLDVFSSWYRDGLVLKETGSEQLLTNLDQIERLKTFFRDLTVPGIQKTLEIIEKTRETLRYNVNVKLAFEAMLFQLEEK